MIKTFCALVVVALLVAVPAAAQHAMLHPDMVHLPDFTAEPGHPAHIVSGTETITTDTETIVVQAGGNLTIGPGTVRVLNLIGLPFSAITVADNTHLYIRNVPFNLAFDQSQFGHGLIIMGTITAHGQVKTPKARLAVQPLAGSSVLVLASPVVGWRVGDNIEVGDTRPIMDDEADFSAHFPRAKVDHAETCVVTLVSGALVNCAQPFLYDHLGGRDDNGDVVIYPMVGNSTRSIVIESEDPNGVRGHVMITGEATADLSYIGLVNLGRTCTDRIDNTTYDGSVVTHRGECENGRYALHAHHLNGPRTAAAGAPQASFIGVTIVNPRKWGVAIHDSHYGLYKDLVIVRPIGAGVVFETGQEYKNTLDGTLIVDVIGSNTVGDDDIGGGSPPRSIALDGDGVWLAPANYIRNNFVVGARFTGYRSVLGTSSGAELRCPLFPGADPMMADESFACRNDTLPFFQFDHNEVWGGYKAGALFYQVGKDVRDTTIQQPFTVNGFTSVASQDAFRVSNSDILFLNDFLIVGGYGVSTGRLKGVQLDQNKGVTFTCVYMSGLFSGISATQPGYADLTDPNWLTVHGRCADGSISRISANVGVLRSWDPHNQPRGTQSHGNVELRDVDVVALPTGGYPPIRFWNNLLAGGDGTDVTVLSRWLNYNVNGRNTEVFAPQQASWAPMPATGTPYTDPFTFWVWNLFGASTPGLTNAQAWAREGVAFGGRVATCNEPGEHYALECPQDATPPSLPGCIDPSARNYNPLATVSDGSCTYPPPPPTPVPGCTDPSASNYNPAATVSDGSCVFPPPRPVPGCTDAKATNFNPKATVSDGSCTFPPPPPTWEDFTPRFQILGDRYRICLPNLSRCAEGLLIQQ